MKKFNSLLIGLIISISNTTLLFAQDKNDAYDFSTIISKEDWKYISYKEKVEALQIPDSIIKVISTEGLIETCLNYPLFGVITAFNNMLIGFDQISTEFNGLQELLKRTDRGIKLIEKYKTMNPNQFDETWTNLQKGQFAVKFFYIELLLAQEEILSSLNKESLVVLLEESLSKQRVKKSLEMFETFGITTPFVMARTLNALNDEEFSMKSNEKREYSIYINTLIIEDNKIIDEIELSAEQYLSRNL